MAPPWSNGRYMVISSLLNEHFNVLGLMSVFFLFLGSVHDMVFHFLIHEKHIFIMLMVPGANPSLSIIQCT